MFRPCCNQHLFRALKSPIDASLALWSEGRRERIAELESELGQIESQQRGAQLQKRQKARSGGGEAVDFPKSPTTSSSGSRPLRAQEDRRGAGREDRRIVADGEQTKGDNIDDDRRSRIDHTRCAHADSTPPPPHGNVFGGRPLNGDCRCRRPTENTLGGGSVCSTTSEPRAPAPPTPPGVVAAENKTPERREDADGGTKCAGVAPAVRLPTTTLEERLRLWDKGWRPPPLRELPREGEGFFSEWTHLGQPERFELVKSANRYAGFERGWFGLLHVFLRSCWGWHAVGFFFGLVMPKIVTSEAAQGQSLRASGSGCCCCETDFYKTVEASCTLVLGLSRQSSIV